MKKREFKSRKLPGLILTFPQFFIFLVSLMSFLSDYLQVGLEIFFIRIVPFSVSSCFVHAIYRIAFLPSVHTILNHSNTSCLHDGSIFMLASDRNAIKNICHCEGAIGDCGNLQSIINRKGASSILILIFRWPLTSFI